MDPLREKLLHSATTVPTCVVACHHVAPQTLSVAPIGVAGERPRLGRHRQDAGELIGVGQPDVIGGVPSLPHSGKEYSVRIDLITTAEITERFADRGVLLGSVTVVSGQTGVPLG